MKTANAAYRRVEGKRVREGVISEVLLSVVRLLGVRYWDGAQRERGGDGRGIEGLGQGP